jgi:hypothetical protein
MEMVIMKIENLSVKSFEKHTTETEEGTSERFVATLENLDCKVRLSFKEEPPQAFVPNEQFSVTLSNPQKKLNDEN